ncbi:attachment p12 family protein [Lacinutrix venerupis]|nr:FeoB-associated Cys-rich membrane protein [Lacinutrix venerupis]RLJ63238.1 attachment p12 family protein [Lacinutrix venerupis]
MSTLFQDIIVFTILAVALVFLFKKYIWKKKAKKACGTDDCGCH